MVSISKFDRIRLNLVESTHRSNICQVAHLESTARSYCQELADARRCSPVKMTCLDLSLTLADKHFNQPRSEKQNLHLLTTQAVRKA